MAEDADEEDEIKNFRDQSLVPQGLGRWLLPLYETGSGSR